MKLAERLLMKYGVFCGKSIEQNADHLIYGNEFIVAVDEALEEAAKVADEIAAMWLREAAAHPSEGEFNARAGVAEDCGRQIRAMKSTGKQA